MLKEILIILFLIFSLSSCEFPIYEFPYPDYLGQWRDSISGIDFEFNQSELVIDGNKYQYWKVSHDSLLLRKDPQTPPLRVFMVIKKPYLSPDYEWKMILNEDVRFYLKKM